GVDVYSSVPGGGYNGNYSGTSMAGPHAAGVVGLIREANPNLDVDSIKQILMDTARDLGDTGEENTYGWGIVDAYAAVVAATVGFGQIEGMVTNQSWNDSPIEGAEVRIADLGNRFYTDETGLYEGSGPAGLHMIVASHPAFRSDSALVEIVANELVVQDFALEDITGPFITDVSDPQATTDTAGPYAISAHVTDPSTVESVSLFYRLNGGGWIEEEMTPVVSEIGDYIADIPGMPAGTRIDFYVYAEDGNGLSSTEPATAPDDFYSLYITELVYTYDAEYDDNWQLGDTGDDAETGIWIRADPVGTTYNGQPVQPEDDHTVDPGVNCFVTGNGTVGGEAGAQDVDGGCTTLLSRLFDLSDAERAFIHYHRWYGQTGNAVDDEFVVDVSSDGGTTWYPLERVPGNDNIWRKVTFDIADAVALTDQIRFRFLACDLNNGGLVEAAIDDVSIETFVPNPASADESGSFARTTLGQNRPNPFNPVTTIRYSLANPADARLAIYDAGGRLVRVLLDGRQTAGSHHAIWDGRDESGEAVGSGVYFYRLEAGAFEQSRRMIILK
ncbi:MAG: S8 family serine peptidase, partial [Candidatus Eisenbacteria bacterium]|nr:S8 family serine peptidase [Candidatus Eisenbacteria bacterium]